MKKVVMALTGILLCLLVEGQTKKILGIGDTLPDVMMDVLEKGSLKKVSLKGLYQRQNLIIDFWATWCVACIKGIAETDSVLKEFKNEAMIFPVTYEDAETIKRFTLKNKLLSERSLLYGVNDTLLMGNAIPFRVLPHEVWIDRNGVIKAITYPDEVTKENIRSFVNNEQLNIEGKTDEMDFDFGKPLAFKNNRFYYRSILGPYKEGVASYSLSSPVAQSYQRDNRLNRFMMTNSSVLGLYYAAYSHQKENLKLNRVEIYVKDSLAVNPYLDKNLERKKRWAQLYCYELMLPRTVPADELFSTVFEELNRSLPYKGSVEFRFEDCLVLVNREPAKNPCSNGGKTKMIWEQGLLKQLVNHKLDVLTEYLNWNMELPVINESGYTERCDMEIVAEPLVKSGEPIFNMEKMRNCLLRYGFDLVKEKRMVPKLVIMDK